MFQWNKVKYKGLAKFQAGAGQDGQSAFADPLFVNPSAANFDLQAGSPALGAGEDLGAAIVGTVDLAGNPRVAGGKISIGAYQQ
ncbi:MAG: choice-of-anchor Q domain-containing protein [Rhodospirillales bacterium]